ncbi:MAG: tRNA uridine(34) 5-carboxymethylaminomethyl modification radical SAM/GNAT enzyme Elp3 [Thermoplasmatota archaeon]
MAGQQVTDEQAEAARVALAAIAADVAVALEAGKVHHKDGLHKVKQQAARRHRAPRMPSDPDLVPFLPEALVERFAHLLRKKPTRSLAGVAVVAVMSSPARCPHGTCIYCPGGPDVDAPQSYTGFEPSTMRAKRFDYDPYRIVQHRLATLEHNGHAIDKVDLVVQGGTFPSRDAAYRDWFIAGLYAALNDGPAEAPDADVATPLPLTEAAWRLLDDDARAARLRALQQENEGARCRAIGLTIETKPDWCLEAHVDEMLRYGATRVELGLQCLDDDTLRFVHRGHTLEESRRAMQIARDAGLKLCVHMMPGLPRGRRDAPDGGKWATDEAEDIRDMERLFAEEDWRPDLLKIYPTLVVQEGETGLKAAWARGDYVPYDTAAATRVVAASKPLVPEWCRIQRIDRDIPTTHVEAGVLNSNLRQLAQLELQRKGKACRCLRCREVGHRQLAGGPAADPDRLVLVRRDFDASGGKEAFLSFEDPEADAVAGYLRLRLVGPDAHRSEARADAGPVAIVREVKVPGVAQALGADAEGGGEGGWQHRGLGAKLLAAAEEVAFTEWGAARVLVIAGVGVRAYYRKHGYQDLGPYVAKDAHEADSTGAQA